MTILVIVTVLINILTCVMYVKKVSELKEAEKIIEKLKGPKFIPSTSNGTGKLWNKNEITLAIYIAMYGAEDFGSMVELCSRIERTESSMGAKVLRFQSYMAGNDANLSRLDKEIYSDFPTNSSQEIALEKALDALSQLIK